MSGRNDRAAGRRAGAAGLLCGACLLAARIAGAADLLDLPARPARLAASALTLDVAALADGRIVCVGERGQVLSSEDGGRTYLQVQTPTRETLTRVYFLDARRGWIVGHDEVILATTDGGRHWGRVHYDPKSRQPLFDVWFGADGVGYAVGAYSTVLRSADFGATWEPVPFEPSAPPKPTGATAPLTGDDGDLGVAQPHLYGLREAAPGRLYLAGEAGHLYRSDDAGRHWRSLPSPYAGTFFGVLPLEGESVLAYGLRGHLYRSDDGGATWQALEVASSDLLAAATRLPGGGAVVVGLSGAVLVSADARHFVLRRAEDRLGYSGVAARSAGLVLVGEGGVRGLAIRAGETTP